MELTRRYATRNMHYKNNKLVSVKTLVLHSVGVPQPNPMIFAENRWNIESNKYLAQIVIGADAAYEVLPCTSIKGKTVFCWHVGNANSYSIGAELTEPATIKYTSGANWIDLNPEKTRAFVMKTYENAVDIFAQLCKFHEIDPLGDRAILSHSECYKLGIGTGHVDVEHIWDKFGLTMNQFRKDVKAKLAGVKIDFSASIVETQKPVVDASIVTGSKTTFDTIKVGDILYFDGGKQYSSANADTGSDAKASKVKVTKKYLATSDHPIHARSVNDKGNYVSGVYGWVDVSDLVNINSSTVPYLIKVTASELNIRSGPGTNYKIVSSIKNQGVYTIIEESNGWGKLKSKIGWISLAYTKKV